MAQNQSKRKGNYWKLREAGYTSYDANRLKDGSPETIEKLIEARRQFRIEQARRELQKLGAE